LPSDDEQAASAAAVAHAAIIVMRGLDFTMVVLLWGDAVASTALARATAS
jgi:hypothetical protein